MYEMVCLKQDRQYMYKRNNEARSCNHCCSGTTISITHCACVCSLSYPACNAHVPYCHLLSARIYSIFPHGLINCTIFEKKINFEYKLCLLILSTNLSETFLILRRTELNTIKNVCWSSCEIPVILSDLNLQAPCVLYIGQEFRYSPENAFYIFNQQICFIIWYLLDRASLI